MWRAFQLERHKELGGVNWPEWGSTDETRQSFLDKVAPKRNRKNFIPGTYPAEVVVILQVNLTTVYQDSRSSCCAIFRSGRTHIAPPMYPCLAPFSLLPSRAAPRLKSTTSTQLAPTPTSNPTQRCINVAAIQPPNPNPRLRLKNRPEQNTNHEPLPRGSRTDSGSSDSATRSNNITNPHPATGPK